jgi:hypothetical protein
MKTQEIIELLGVIAVVDKRTVGEADVIAWETIIGDLPAGDALLAVRDHFRERPGVWLEPGHIVQRVRAVRRDRLERRSLAEIQADEDRMDARMAPRLAEAEARKRAIAAFASRPPELSDVESRRRLVERQRRAAPPQPMPETGDGEAGTAWPSRSGGGAVDELPVESNDSSPRSR